MKKLFFVAVAAIAMLATSCSKDDASTVVGGETSTVTFAVEAPVMATRALGDGTTAVDLSWAVYAADGTYLEALSGSKAGAFSSLKANVEIELVNGKEYAVIFWAQAPGAPYTFDKAAKKVTVADALTSNKEAYDAFYKYETIAEVAGPRTQTIVLTRPFAQLNIATADTAKAADGGLVVAQTKVVVPAYNTLNLVDGSVSGEAERTFAMADILTGETIEVGGKKYDLLSMNYLLVNAKELEIVKFTVKNGTFEEEFTYNNVPLQRNYKTNIIGNLLTSTYDFTIEINPIFDDEYESNGWVGAKVNGVAYQTLAEAIANAYDGDVIELSEGEFVFPTQISTKGTRAAERFLSFVGFGEKTVISFNSTPGGADGGLNCYADGLSLKFENLKVVSPNTGSAYTGGFGRAKSIEFNNCTYVGQYRSLNYTKWQDCTIDPQNSYIYTDAFNVDFINCKFNSSEGKGIQVYGDPNNFSSTINVIGCEFVAAKQGLTGSGRPVSAIDINSQGEKFTVNIENTTAEGYGPGDYSGNGLWNIKGGVEHITVMVDGELAAISAGTDEKLESALKENKEYISIELTADTTVDVTAWETLAFGGDKTKSITIEGNGHKLTFNQTNSDWNNITVANGAKLIIKNATLTNAGYNDGPWNRHDLNFACDVELDNVVSDKAIALKAGGKLNKVTINDKNTSDTYALWIQPNGQTVTLTDCTIDMLDCTDGRGIKIDEQYVSAPEKVILNVSNTVFKTEEKAAILVKSKAGAEINVSEIDITAVAADTEFAVWVDEASKAHAAKVVVNGANVKVEGTEVKIVEVTTVEDFKAALTSAGAANAGSTVIELAKGEYVAPADWTPIKVDGYNGADIVTLNGNGATIKGLKSALFAGGFAGGSGIVIKDLTIEGAEIDTTGSTGYGAFIGNADSMNEITLINCHLKSSTIEVAGDVRVGGLVGWVSGYSKQDDGPVKTYVTIDNCSVEDCYITAPGSVGGICGHAGASDWTYITIKNCTVKNNHLVSTDDGSWRTGVVVGTANNGHVEISNITESGNTLEQVGKTAPEGDAKRHYYGRFVPSGTGTLTIDGVAIQ